MQSRVTDLGLQAVWLASHAQNASGYSAAFKPALAIFLCIAFRAIMVIELTSPYGTPFKDWQTDCNIEMPPMCSLRHLFHRGSWS